MASFERSSSSGQEVRTKGRAVSRATDVWSSSEASDLRDSSALVQFRRKGTREGREEGRPKKRQETLTLTASAVMWLSYAAYLMLRQGIEDPGRRERFSAIYGIIAFASVIMVYFGVRFIEQTIHPVVIGPSAGVPETSMGLTPRMLQAMMFSFLTFTFVYATLLWHRVRLARLTDRVNVLKARLMTQ